LGLTHVLDIGEATIIVMARWKPTEEAKPEPTGNGEPRKNPGEKPGKVAEKHSEAGCEAITDWDKDLYVKKRRMTELVEIPKCAERVAEGSKPRHFLLNIRGVSG
jgi:hypothetical protein